MPESSKKTGFGLYVHWPFCLSKCPYCDFNSHVAQTTNQSDWTRAYLNAIAFYAAETPGRRLDSIYFGGGTPSLMEPATVQAIIDQAQRYWLFSNSIEITLEANPGSVETARFEGYRVAGVNRISLGIQALNDLDLRRLGRTHSAGEALNALQVAHTYFGRVSFDLIYARQNQSLTDWEAELSFALSLNPDHLSLYQLSIEPETVFGALAKSGRLGGLPEEDICADMYAITQNLCKNKGLSAYEVSNHAAEKDRSRHNMIYWDAGDYIGIGPGAHGRITLPGGRVATETPASPQAWLQSALSGRSGESRRNPLSGPEQALEYLIMGLRTTAGISLGRLVEMGGSLPDAGKVADLAGLGLIKTGNGHLRATSKGMPVLNGIIRELAPD